MIQKKFKFISDLVKEKNLDFIALSETGRKDCSGKFLKNLCGGMDFLWHCKDPRGRSGGMLVGVNLLTFDMGKILYGNLDLSVYPLYLKLISDHF